mgnify:CR=1 FL=1
MNELDTTLDTLANKVRALIKKNNELVEANLGLQIEKEEIEKEKNNISNELTEEKDRRQKDKEALSELIREVDECLAIFTQEEEKI